MQMTRIAQSLGTHIHNGILEAHTFLNSHPELKEAAEGKDLFKVQELLEKLLAKEHSEEAMKKLISEKINKEYKETVDFMKEHDLNVDLVVDLLAFISNSKGSANWQMIFGHLKTKKKFFSSLKEVGEFLYRCEECKLFKVTEGDIGFTNYDPFIFPKEVLGWRISNLAMVCPPRHLYRDSKGRVKGGYITIPCNIWSKKAEGNNKAPLDFLNRQNKIPYQINWETWDEYLKNPNGIPEQESETWEAYMTKLDNFFHLLKMKAFYMEVLRQLGINEVYLLNFFDYRGRNYPKAWLINPQGTDIDKAILNFPKKNLTKKGATMLAISIANCYNASYEGKDLDKHVFDKRLEFFKKNFYELRLLDRDAFKDKLREFMKQAESPFCFFTQMLALYDAYQANRNGEVPMVGCITHWDATASGYQINAIWRGDREVAKFTNLTHPEERWDVYTEITKAFHAAGLSGDYPRSFMKKAVLIPKIYGSVNCVKENFTEEEAEIIYKVLDQYPMFQIADNLKNLWDSQQLSYSWRTPDGFEVYREVKQAYGEPTKKSIKEFIFAHKGKTFYVSFEANEAKKSSVEYGPNVTHSADGYMAREIARRMNFSAESRNRFLHIIRRKDLWKCCEDDRGSQERMKRLLDLGKVFGMYSVRILEEINFFNVHLVPEEVLRKLISYLPESRAYVSEIHDSFGVHPNDVDNLMRVYRDLLVDMAEGRFLEAVEDDIKHENDFFTIKREDPELVEQIKKSVYALC